MTPDPNTQADELCPNCLTSWKCNGPHISRAPVTEQPCETCDGSGEYGGVDGNAFDCPYCPVTEQASDDSNLARPMYDKDGKAIHYPFPPQPEPIKGEAIATIAVDAFKKIDAKQWAERGQADEHLFGVFEEIGDICHQAVHDINLALSATEPSVMKSVREALEKIAKRPDLPNPDRDADWKNCMKNSAYEARAALRLLDEAGVK